VRLRAGSILAAIGAAFVLASCGGGTTTVIKQRTVTQGSSTQSTASTTASTTSSTASVPSEPPTQFVDEATFQSPTGNIGCSLIGGIARCDIVKRDWSPPPRPPSCPSEVDYGQGLEVGRSGPADLVCAGDTARDPSSPKLPYGTASQVGDFVCVSRSSGITCTNRLDGHGFFISIQSYRLF